MTDLSCRQCGSPFTDPRPPTSGRKPAFCSDVCRQAHQRAQTRRYNADRAARRRAYGMCLDCPERAELLAVPNTDFCTHHAAKRAATSAKQTLAKYGLTLEAFAALYERQGGRCAVCNTSATETGCRLAVDHDHSCCPEDGSCGQCVRGLLCSGCNTGIGFFRDNPDRLESAAAYLRAR